MNSYELSRAWFDFSFENPDKIRPIHSAIFFYAIEHCNRLGWKEKFGFPSQMVMEAIGVKNWRTYIKALNEIIDFGFIELHEKSKNQFSANIIAIVKNDKARAEATTKALDKALSKQLPEQSRSSYSSTYQSTVGINKPKNLKTNKQEIIKEDPPSAFIEFHNLYPGTKRACITEFQNFRKKHKDWSEIIGDLKPLLSCQINVREVAETAGQFVPPHKNMQTYINNRSWEEELNPGKDTSDNFDYSEGF